MVIKVIDVKESFVDKRGKITNILEKSITSVVIITCLGVVLFYRIFYYH